MITNVAFTVPGKPQGKGRCRVGKSFGGHAKMYTPSATVAYEGLIALAAQQAMAGAAPFSGPVALEIEAVHTPPLSWSKKRRHEALSGLAGHPVAKPDLDNVVKAVGDGANGVLWHDDRQIASVRATRRWGEVAAVHVIVASDLPAT